MGRRNGGAFGSLRNEGKELFNLSYAPGYWPMDPTAQIPKFSALTRPAGFSGRRGERAQVVRVRRSSAFYVDGGVPSWKSGTQWPPNMSHPSRCARALFPAFEKAG